MTIMNRCFMMTAASFMLLNIPSVATRAAQVHQDQSTPRNVLLQARGSDLIGKDGNSITLRCVNLSPWLERQPYLLRKNLVALFRSPSEIEGRLTELIGPVKSDEFWLRWESYFMVDEDFRRIRRQGFNCVRLPLNYRRLTVRSSQAPPSLKPEALVQVDRALKMGKKSGVMVIIALISAPGGQNNLATVADLPSSDTTPRLWIGPSASSNQDDLVEIWRQFSLRYAGASGLAGYDVLNEPNVPAGVSRMKLPLLYRRIVSAIRQNDRNTMIFLQGDRYSKDSEYAGFLPSLSSNIAYSFHAYNWFSPEWATPSNKSILPYSRLANNHNVPIWLGEFGEDRMEWIAKVVSLSEKHNIGWALWPWKRVDLGSDRPVIQTIHPPQSWNRLMDYLIRSPFAAKPSLEQVEKALDEMIIAIRTENTTENATLIKALNQAGKNAQSK